MFQAEDMSGLFDTVNITFYINDTNQAPSCHNYSVTMDLVTPVGTEVVTVSCADNDTTPEFSELVYRGNIGGNNGRCNDMRSPHKSSPSHLKPLAFS